MSLKNLALDVESIALALSEEGGYEYYHIDDDLKELAKNVSDMQTENAKLREQIDAAHMSRLLTENENESLRELVRDMLHDTMENVCSKAYWCDEKNWQTCNDKECGNHLYVKMARELGVEVDG